MKNLPKIIKYPLAAIGILVVIVIVNISLGLLYMNMYKDEVSKVVDSYATSVIEGDYNSAYSHFSQSIKKQTPYDKFKQGLEFSLRDSGNFNSDYKIVYESFGNALGTTYTGPQATFRVKLSQQKVETINEFVLVREGNSWKIDDIKVYLNE